MRVILISGKLCCGKGHYISNHFNPQRVITTSDVVRKISGKITREQLQQTGDLDVDIALELINQVKNIVNNLDDGDDSQSYVVIDGIRQVSIIELIEQEFEDVRLLWIEASREIRRDRFNRRNADKDLNINFDIADANDSKLGIDQVYQYISSHPNGKTISG